MDIYSGTGVLKTGILRVTKGISELIVGTDCQLSELTNETISIFKEANNGNVEFCNTIPLLDFMLLGTMGTGMIYPLKNTAFKSVASCQLTPGFAVFLAANESLLIKLENLKSAKTYMLAGAEEPFTTGNYYRLQTQNSLVGEKSKVFEVADYEAVCIGNYQAITELVANFDNGSVVRMTQTELVNNALDTDAVLAISTTGAVVTQLDAAICFPLHGLNSIEIYKDAAQAVSLTLKNDM